MVGGVGCVEEPGPSLHAPRTARGEFAAMSGTARQAEGASVDLQSFTAAWGQGMDAGEAARELQYATLADYAASPPEGEGDVVDTSIVDPLPGTPPMPFYRAEAEVDLNAVPKTLQIAPHGKVERVGARPPVVSAEPCA